MSIITDMDIANPELIPIESEWVESELNTGLEAVKELEQRMEHLASLSAQAYKARDKVSLEAVQSQPEASSISLEGYVGTITRKNALTIELNKKHLDAVDAYNLGLENYVKDIEEDFGEKLQAYEKIHTKLRTTDADIETPKNKNVQVNHTRVFEMFHIKDVFQGDKALETIRKEDTNVARLITMVGTAVGRIRKDINDLGKDDKLDRKAQDLPKVDRMFLMFNRRGEVVDGQFDYKDNKTKGPKKSYTWKQNIVIVLGGIFLGNLGVSLGYLQTPKGNNAKVDVKLAEVHRFIRYVEGFEDNIDDLTQHIDELIKLFPKVSEENQSALNRRAAPIMELAEFIVKHVTDITRGTDTLFSRLVRKN